MRKTIAILLTVSLLVLMLCACGGRSSQPVSMDGESYEILDTGEKNEAAGEKGQSADKKEKKDKDSKDGETKEPAASASATASAKPTATPNPRSPRNPTPGRNPPLPPASWTE